MVQLPVEIVISRIAGQLAAVAGGGMGSLRRTSSHAETLASQKATIGSLFVGPQFAPRQLGKSAKSFRVGIDRLP